jgi:DNA repair exonuclease SbcCD ATPase subunit
MAQPAVQWVPPTLSTPTIAASSTSLSIPLAGALGYAEGYDRVNFPNPQTQPVRNLPNTMITQPGLDLTEQSSKIPVLTLTITNFRQWEYCQVQLPLDGITLITGDSGEGKTTLFQALAWTIYGGMSHVAPQHLDDKKVKTIVTIAMPFLLRGQAGILSIERRRNPGRLMLAHSVLPEIYEDDAAQAMLYEIFGASTVWYTTCYLSQKEYNLFTTLPNSEKMELLNTLAFQADDPEAYLEKMTEAIEGAIKFQQSLLDQYQALLNYYQCQLTIYPQALVLTAEQEIQVKTLQSEHSTLIKEKEQQMVSRAQQLRLQQHYRKELLGLIDPLSPIMPNTLIDQLALYHCTLENGVAELTFYLPLLKVRDSLKGQLNQTLAHDIASTSYTETDYHQAVQREQQYRQQEMITTRYQLLYQPDSVDKEIIRLQAAVSEQPYRKLQHQLINNQRQEQTLRQQPVSEPTVPVLPEGLVETAFSVPASLSTTDLEQLIAELGGKRQHLIERFRLVEEANRALSCPQCQTPVRVSEGRLVHFGTLPQGDVTELKGQITAVDQEVIKIKNELQHRQEHYRQALQAYQRSIQEQQQRQQQIMQQRTLLERQYQSALLSFQNYQAQLAGTVEQGQNLQRQYQQLPILDISNTGGLLTEYQEQQYRDQILQLQKVQFHTLPSTSSENIRKVMILQQQHLQRQALQEQYDKTMTELIGPFQHATVQDAQHCLQELQHHRHTLNHYQEQCQKIQGMREALTNQLQNVVIPEDVTVEITQSTEYLKQYAALLIHHQQGIQIMDLQQKVSRAYDAFNAAQQEVVHHHQLREVIMDTYCQALDDVVSIINHNMQLCTELFDHPISVILSLYKLQKSSKSLKPTVNFSINYKGGTFDGLKHLSGGEKDRISLAVTLAMNRLSTCPFILMDESLTALDNNRRDTIIDLFRQHGRPVWLIMHDAVDGMFNHVINVHKLGKKGPVEVA